MNYDTIPEKVECSWHPTIVKGINGGMYAVFGGKWFHVRKSFTLEDAFKHWQAPTPKVASTIEKTWKVSNSKGNGHYLVSYKNQLWHCTCTGFGFRRDCKHVQQTKKEVK